MMDTEPDWVPDVLGTAVAMDVAFLVARNFDSLERITDGLDFSASQLRAIVEKYPGTLVKPPRSAFLNVDRQRVPGQKYMTFDVTFPLWTQDDRRPPLVLRARYIEDLPRTFGTRILDLRVDDLELLADSIRSP